MKPLATDNLSCLIQSFFRTYLVNQRRVTQHTVSAYRDTFRAFLPFLASLLSKSAAALVLADINSKHIIAYLSHLEEERDNNISTRNARLG
jgi:site-specific recombinase XerD